MTVPQATLSPLTRTDGSASYSLGGYTVIGAVNGPVEVQRRDELSEEAAIEVNVRPAVGVGSPKERYLESIIHSTLRHIILTHNHPRTLIQVTLQVLNVPQEESLLRSSFSLSILPALLQASILALLSACIPMSMTFSSALIAVTVSGKLITNPSPKVVQTSASVHVFAFSSQGDLLLTESEGNFGLDEWEKAHAEAKSICCKDASLDDGDAMDRDDMAPDLQSFVEGAVAERVEKSREWKAAS